VTLCQPSPSGLERTIRFGSFAARSDTKRVRFPEVAAGTRAGSEISFMAPTLA